MALPQECLISLARKYGMEIKKDVWANPEERTVVDITVSKVLDIPELRVFKNEFYSGVEIINWEKMAEKTGHRREPHKYEVRISTTTCGYERMWISRTLRGNDIYALMKQACSIIEEHYNRWVGFLERRKRRLLGREEGLWKWLYLIPIAGMFLFRRR